MKKLLVNILCAFIPMRQARKRIRVKLTNPIIKKMEAFAKTLSDKQHPKIKRTYGFRCANFVVTVDDTWVLKFPLTGDGKDISVREQRITDALRNISPIKIPNMEVLNWNGVYVRKYEYIDGICFNKLPRDTQNKHVAKIAQQLANFMYVIGKSNPKEISDLKPKKSEKPRPFFGWNQNDLWDNFILNPKTFDIVGIIDWEGAKFGDFLYCMTRGTGNHRMVYNLLKEYLNLAQHDINTK